MKSSKTNKATELRKLAEEKLENQQTSHQDFSAEEGAKLIHELQVHQIELEHSG